MANTRPPRRLTREARYQQLVELAMPIVAEAGFGDFSLDQLAEQADITRNNLYRYFPRGRPDIVLAVVREAGRELTSGWITDPNLSLEERLRANMGRIAEHAYGPSPAWRIHRMARAASTPEIDQIVRGYLDAIVANISMNNVGTSDPPLRVRLAILGTIAFGETIVDESRNTQVPREEIGDIILTTLLAALKSAESTR